ncbi:MAG: hypothetical protein ACE5E8_02600 [Acidimicrobiia bacterium]
MAREDVGGTVAVLGCGSTIPVEEEARSIPEMVLAAVEASLSDAGMGWDDIDAVVTASVDLFDGLTASNIAVTEVAGAVMKPETRIAADGLAAAIHAVYQIQAEAYRRVLVVAHGKASMAPHWDLTAWAMDPISLQPLGVDFLVVAGLQATVMAAGDAGAERHWAELVARRRRAGAADAMAPPCHASNILASPIVASPLRSGMCAPLGDSACAVVLGAEGRGAVITGAGHDLSPHHPGERQLSRWDGLERACRRAYATAGIGDPSTAFDIAEPSCLFPHEEELFTAAAGIGTGTMISPGGGLFPGTAPVAAGLSRLIAAAEAVAGSEANRVLAHGTWGPAGQGQAVLVVETR